jgi:acetolactate synthase-1/2/3 large subunit
MLSCDYIAQRLYDEGVRHVYGLVGGSTAGLNDGFIKHEGIQFIPFHHEQGAGHAAVGSARMNNKLSVCNVTAGCGVTNAMTSLLDAFEESVSVLFISGSTNIASQAKYINKNKNINIRKYGIQDLDAQRTVEHLCKYAVTIEKIEDIPYELEKAIHIAKAGRPGPVWIDVPGNFQMANIPDEYKKYVPEDDIVTQQTKLLLQALDLLNKAERPLIVSGNGINLGNARSQFKKFVERYKIPFVTTFLSKDIMSYDHDKNIGMLGIKGNRAANFALQNSDCLLILGCSMNVTHVGYDINTFSPMSKKIMIDIDENELKKDLFKLDLSINDDVKSFFALSESVFYPYTSLSQQWNEKCLHWKTIWPIYDVETHRPDVGGLNLYEIVESINRNMQARDCFIADAGQPCYILSTNGKYKENCRYMVQAAQGDMGYALPASVGAYFADPSSNITLVIGEGSFFTNVQELAVIKKYNIPIKIFVINNDGYMCIKQTQDKFFGGRRWGVCKSTGIYFADISKIAAAFEIEHITISTNEQLDDQMPKILHYQNPIIVEFKSQNALDVLPAQAFKPNGVQGGLHDMAPFLSEEELNREMIIKI